MWGLKSPLYMELQSEILDYLSLAMQRDVIVGEGHAKKDDDDSGQAEAKSPSKKRRRRFQPQRSPKRKPRKSRAQSNVETVQVSQDLDE